MKIFKFKTILYAAVFLLGFNANCATESGAEAAVQSVLTTIENVSAAIRDLVNDVPEQLDDDSNTVETAISQVTTSSGALKSSAYSMGQNVSLSGVETGIKNIFSNLSDIISSVLNSLKALDTSFNVLAQAAIKIPGEGNVDVTNASASVSNFTTKINGFISQINTVQKQMLDKASSAGAAAKDSIPSAIQKALTALKGAGKSVGGLFTTVSAQLESDIGAVESVARAVTSAGEAIKSDAESLGQNVSPGATKEKLVAIVNNQAAVITSLSSGVQTINESFNAISQGALDIPGAGNIDVSKQRANIEAVKTQVDKLVTAAENIHSQNTAIVDAINRLS